MMGFSGVRLILQRFKTDTERSGTALKSIADVSKSIYIPRGINTQALDREIKWDFTPADYKVGRRSFFA